ncbi:MAG: transposase [Elainella sp. Prado103]|nr:transposase [Elainella sp. Prado103]
MSFYTAVRRDRLGRRNPIAQLLHKLFGKVFADKGYISQNLSESLKISQNLSKASQSSPGSSGAQLTTRLRRNCLVNLASWSILRLGQSCVLVNLVYGVETKIKSLSKGLGNMRYPYI